jgi:SP family sugar:H+ symporter-like MFS transporter
MSGIKNAFVVALITNLINVFATIPGLWLVEKAGRRQLLFWGAVGMCFSDFIVAIVGSTTNSTVSNKVLIAFVCLFISFFAASWGPTAWVVTGEIFPLKIRAKALSMTTATNWLFNWALAFATPYLVDSGPGNANLGSKVFFIWGGSNFLAIIFVYFFVYETKGLSLEEVDELYHTIGSARDSSGFIPADNYRAEKERGHFAHKAQGEHVEKSGESSVE